MIRPDEAARIVRLRDGERMTFREISAATGLSLATISRTLRRHGMPRAARASLHGRATERNQPEAAQRLVTLREAGASIRAIADETGIPWTTVRNVLVRAGRFWP